MNRRQLVVAAVVVVVVGLVLVLTRHRPTAGPKAERSQPEAAGPAETKPVEAGPAPAERPPVTHRRSELTEHERRALEKTLEDPATAGQGVNALGDTVGRVRAWADRVDAPSTDILGGGGVTIRPHGERGQPEKGGIFDPPR